MKRGSTLFLKVVLLLIAIGAFAGMVWFPQTEGRAANLDFVSIYSDPFIIYLYIASIPFFTALYHAFKLLGYVEINKVFSEISVKAVRNIKYCALAFMGFIAAADGYIMVMSKTTNEDGAGAIAVGLVIVFASAVAATGVAIAQKLLQKAVDMKSENDLTV